MRRVVLLFALAAALTACSETKTGTPSAGGETPTAGSSSTKAPTSSKAPVSRPKKIDLKTVTNACTLLSDAQLGQFNLRSLGESKPLAEFPGAKGCGWLTKDNAWAASVLGVVSAGVEEFEKAVTTGKATKSEVAGFPAYVSKDTSGLQGCFFAVDVADGQSLQVIARPGGKSGKDEESCTMATTYGQAMATTLISGS